MDSLHTQIDPINPFELEYEVTDELVFDTVLEVLSEIGETEVDFDTLVDAHPYGGSRVSPRARVEGGAAYLSSQRVLISREADISMTGVFVATTNPDPVGTQASVRFEHDQESIEFDAEVVRVSFVSDLQGRGRGMGLRFLDMGSEQRRFLAEYVALHHHV